MLGLHYSRLPAKHCCYWLRNVIIVNVATQLHCCCLVQKEDCQGATVLESLSLVAASVCAAACLPDLSCKLAYPLITRQLLLPSEGFPASSWL